MPDGRPNLHLLGQLLVWAHMPHPSGNAYPVQHTSINPTAATALRTCNQRAILAYTCGNYKSHGECEKGSPAQSSRRGSTALPQVPLGTAYRRTTVDAQTTGRHWAASVGCHRCQGPIPM